MILLAKLLQWVCGRNGCSPRAPSPKELGMRGEQAAEDYVRRLGWKVIARNWRCRLGELDMVCLEGSELVFVEVKSRYLSSAGERFLFETITPKKQRKLWLLHQMFLRAWPRYRACQQVRIDVIGVLLCRESLKLGKIHHRRAAISAGF